MGRAKKKGAPTSGEFSLFDETETADTDSDEDLPKDEAGRAKIKQQYVELLGIRIQKLSGRILNRERINKTVEGVYFICASCKRVCHNLDDGLVEDENNVKNQCVVCSKGGDGSKTVRKPSVKKIVAAPAEAEAAAPAPAPAKAAKTAAKPVKKAPKK